MSDCAAVFLLDVAFRTAPRARRGARAFAVERRAIPASPPRETAFASRRAHFVGVAAVRDALSPRPLADDVARILAGRTTFPTLLWGELL